MPIRNAEEKADLHVDFVPMVDVLFNLLIFFLLATSMSQAEREMSIALPRAVSSGPITSAAREIIVNVDQEGRAIVGGRVVNDEELGSMLRTAVEGNPGQKVNVRGDRTTAYANVVRVLDLCKQAGIQQPYIETTPVR
jgi:biopolymer transport protein ExbD